MEENIRRGETPYSAWLQLQSDYENYKLCKAASFFGIHPEEMQKKEARWIEWAWVCMTADKLIDATPPQKRDGEGEPMIGSLDQPFELVD